MTITVDLAVLKESHPHLWRRVVGIYNDTTTREVDTAALKPEVAEELRVWLSDQALRKKQKEEEPFRIDPTEAERRALERKREADEQAGLARLQQFVDERNLEPTQENAERVAEWIQNHDVLKGHWSAVAVDTAIAYLAREGKLTFRKQTPAPQPPAQPAEVEMLANGEPRLPLGTKPSSKFSIVQLRDLDARERAARGRGGWHGATF